MTAPQTPPEGHGAPPPAAGDGQGGAPVTKKYIVVTQGLMNEPVILGAYEVATPLDACKQAYPCCFDFELPCVDEYEGLSVYEVSRDCDVEKGDWFKWREGHAAEYVQGYVTRRVDWPETRQEACAECRRAWF